jgi:hypothetical protein
MLTYSINVGTVTEANSLSDLNSVLNQLPDNTSQLIAPVDVRNAVLTGWSNIVFKPTTVSASSVEYIGIDSSPAGIALKEKISIGKRNLLGSDIMDDTLLNSDSDVFIFNTKPDLVDQSSTKVSILAGPSSSFYYVAPYVESLYSIGATQNYVDLNLVSPTGNINLISNSQYVTINGLYFPTFTQSLVAAPGDVLRYASDGYLEWYPMGAINIDTIIQSGTVSITGHPVLINGSPIELTNPRPVPVTIGGVTAGTTFSSTPVVTVLNNLLYPYVPPMVYIDLNVPTGISQSVYVEQGSIATLSYDFNITSGTYPVLSIFTNPGGDNPPTPSNLVGSSNISAPLSSTIYTLSAGDGTQSTTATASLTYIYPMYYSLTSSVIDFTQPNVEGTLNKLTFPKGDVSQNLVGDNVHIYFLYPSTYGNLSGIVDAITGWNFISSFTQIYSGISLTSSSYGWTTNYNVYSYTSGYGKTTVNSNWTFKF